MTAVGGSAGNQTGSGHVSERKTDCTEASNAEAKAELKAYKAYLDKMTTEAISLAKSNASRECSQNPRRHGNTLTSHNSHGE